MTAFLLWARPLVPTVICLTIALALYVRKASEAWDMFTMFSNPEHSDYLHKLVLPFFYLGNALVWVLIALVLRFL